MTREEKQRAIQMRIDGLTYERIGKELGVTKQGVHDMFKRLNQLSNKKYYLQRLSNIPYVGIKNYMKDNEQSFHSFGKKIYGENAGSNKCSLGLYKKLTGERKLTLNEIKTILYITGLTFEECFEERAAENEV